MKSILQPCSILINGDNK